MTSALAYWIGAHDRLPRLGNRDWGYWILGSVFLVISVLVSPYLNDYLHLAQARAWLFQRLNEFGPRPLAPRFVKVVLIDDDDYWHGDPAGRRPINREYLSKLVLALDEAKASVIALDFDVRLPDPKLPGTAGEYDEILPAYRDETAMLMTAIGRAADHGRKIVLSKTIAYTDDGEYQLRADIYQPYGICSKINMDGSWDNPGTPEFPLTETAQRNIRCGYIALPYDMRLLPPRLPLASGGTVDSFSLTLAKAVNPDIAAKIGDNQYYGSYLPTQAIDDFHTVTSAGAVLIHNTGAVDLDSKAVIVGAKWHMSAYKVGETADSHDTPIGPITGALIHENFAEAILDSRTYGFVSEWSLLIVELVLSIVAMIVFAYSRNAFSKLAWFLVFSAFLVFVQWGMLLMLGTSFDALIPLFGLFLHSLLERLFENDGAPERAHAMTR